MNVLLAYVPRWVASEGFTALIREASGDFEAQFFVPGYGCTREFLESKDHTIAPAEFWREIDRFQKFDTERNRQFEWFTLVSAGLSKDLHPLVNGLRRLRGPYSFYNSDSAILENSFTDYVAIVEKLDRTRSDAEFIFTKVQIDSNWTQARENGLALFRDALSKELPAFQEVSSRTIDNAHAALVQLLRASRNTPVTRQEIEARLREFLPASQRGAAPVRMYTESGETESAPAGQIVFRWARFFGGADRVYPPSEDWEGHVLRQLRETKKWMVEHRSTFRITLSGNRRLSASLAFGSVFSAVAGFTIDMIGRNNMTWSTDAHAGADTPAYELIVGASSDSKRADQLVVSVGMPRDISADVEAALSAHGLQAAAILHLHGIAALVSADQANAIVAEIKQRVAAELRKTGATGIHLFIASPAFLALLLGHRLNATAPVQCYEWAGGGTYVETCLLA
jgi:hypothetical protein